MPSTPDSKSKVDLAELKRRLNEQGFLPIRIMSGSMEPVIKTGEKLTVAEIAEPLRIFDIIVFWDGSVMVCHFVWRINRAIKSKGEHWIVTRSLVSSREDFPILESHILGRVTDRKLPFLRKLRILLEVWFR
jgi:signal peptidase I